MGIRKVSVVVLFLPAILLLSACFKDLTKTNVLYQNDFETAKMDILSVAVWNNTGTAVIGLPEGRFHDYGGTKMLGPFNNGLVQLNLPGLPPHQSLRMEFDLYIQDNWKADLWVFSVDGSSILQTTFSNDSTVKQAYPNWNSNPSDQGPAGRNSENRDLPGACSLASSAHGTSKYRVVKTISHTSPTLQMQLNDAGNFFNDTCQRSWSIDNLKISVFNN